MKKVILATILLLAPLMIDMSVAAPPFDRTVTWTQSRTDTLGGAIPAGDSLVTHVFVCDSATDNTTFAEIGVSASNALTWSGTSTQQTNTTKHYRARTTWIQQGTMSAYSPPTSFFLQGRAAVPAGAPAVQ